MSSSSTVTSAGSSSNVTVPVSLVELPDEDARRLSSDAIDPARADLPFSDEVMSCVEGVVAEDRAMLAVVLGGVAVDSEGYSVVVDAGQACEQQLVFAVQFADGLQSSSGGVLSEEQMACLRDRFAGLPAEEFRALNEAAIDRESVDRDVQGAKLKALIKGCGVEMPG